MSQVPEPLTPTLEAMVCYNCTPHALRVFASPEASSTPLSVYEKNDQWNLRVRSQEQKVVGRFQGAPVLSPPQADGFSEQEMALIERAHQEKAALLLSTQAAQELRRLRPDFAGHLLVPNTSPAGVVRNAAGEIVGVTSWVQY